MKPWWQSKTLWINVLALVALVASGEAGIEVPANIAVPVLAIVNGVLRILTSQAIGASSAPAPGPPTASV